jgi:predicted nucleotidyltransferase
MKPSRYPLFIQHRGERKIRATQEAQRRRLLLAQLNPIFKRYALSRVFVFGSTLTNRCQANSDIDLYVEGIPPECYWDLWRELEECAQERIDLYCERDNAAFTQKIRERGTVIYEA